MILKITVYVLLALFITLTINSLTNYQPINWPIAVLGIGGLTYAAFWLNKKK